MYAEKHIKSTLIHALMPCNKVKGNLSGAEEVTSYVQFSMEASIKNEIPCRKNCVPRKIHFTFVASPLPFSLGLSCAEGKER